MLDNLHTSIELMKKHLLRPAKFLGVGKYVLIGVGAVLFVSLSPFSQSPLSPTRKTTTVHVKLKSLVFEFPAEYVDTVSVNHDGKYPQSIRLQVPVSKLPIIIGRGQDYTLVNIAISETSESIITMKTRYIGAEYSKKLNLKNLGPELTIMSNPAHSMPFWSSVYVYPSESTHQIFFNCPSPEIGGVDFENGLCEAFTNMENSSDGEISLQYQFSSKSLADWKSIDAQVRSFVHHYEHKQEAARTTK